MNQNGRSERCIYNVPVQCVQIIKFYIKSTKTWKMNSEHLCKYIFVMYLYFCDDGRNCQHTFTNFHVILRKQQLSYVAGVNNSYISNFLFYPPPPPPCIFFNKFISRNKTKKGVIFTPGVLKEMLKGIKKKNK